MSRKILFCNSQFRYYNDRTMVGDGLFRSKWTVKNGIVYYYSYVFDNWVQDTGEIQSPGSITAKCHGFSL